MGHFAVEGDRLDGAVGLEHDGAAGGLVAAAGLHADIAVLDDVEAADAVDAADAVQLGEHLGRSHVFTVDGDDVAVAVGQLDVGGDIRRFFRGSGPLPHVFFVLGPGVFQHAALIGDVQQVGVHGVRGLLLAVTLDRDAVLLGIVHQLLAGQQVPLAPGSDDLHARFERIGAQFETHLVVALAGGAMGDGVGAGLVGDLDQALGDQRTGDGGTQQVLAFVDGVGAEHRVDEVADELFAQVVDVDFLDAHGLGLGAGRLDLLALAEVGGEGHHFAVIGILQPLEDHRGVQATGISQDNLLHVRHAINSTGVVRKTRDSTDPGGQITVARQLMTTRRQILSTARRTAEVRSRA
ncbi:hypothetical protein D3C85_1036220 [compost metagenome]